MDQKNETSDDNGSTKESTTILDKIVSSAKAVDSWRIFPRIFISVYIVLLYQVVHWAMAQEALTMEQSGLVATMVGVGAAWFALYVNTPKK
tara:strand:- start:1251 stop:1523 length:273 start_codon:yes stop_codon:yes gene_type:complete